MSKALTLETPSRKVTYKPNRKLHYISGKVFLLDIIDYYYYYDIVALLYTYIFYIITALIDKGIKW